MSIIQLDEEDTLFDSESFLLLHKTRRISDVDPTLFFHFSREFARRFQDISRKVNVNQKLEKLEKEKKEEIIKGSENAVNFNKSKKTEEKEASKKDKNHKKTEKSKKGKDSHKNKADKSDVVKEKAEESVKSSELGESIKEDVPTMVCLDKVDTRAFEKFVACCQMCPVAPSCLVLADLLGLAVAWDSPSLIAKIESLLSTEVDPSELIAVFNKQIKNDLDYSRLMRIITLNLPRFIEAPIFSSLRFDIIERIVSEYKGRLTPAQLILLCYAASVHGGIEAFRFVKYYSFDNMSLQSATDLQQVLNRCTFRQLRDFLYACGRVVKQLLKPINEHIDFRSSWEGGDNGNADDAFSFYLRLASQIGDKHDSAMQEVFLKTAADRGHAEAQYHYGKVLLDRAKTEEQEDLAIEYLIQAASKGVKDAIELLEPYFTLSQLSPEVHDFIYQNLALQIVLLNYNEDNIMSSRQNILALNFNKSEEHLQILSQNIMKAVHIRQRSEKLYASLILHLSTQDGYEKVKQNIFSLVISSLFTNDPRRACFINLKFLYLCHEYDVFSDEEMEKSIIEFLKAHSSAFTKSALMVFYWFAPIIDTNERDLFNFLFMKLLVLERGQFGVIDEYILRFKEQIRDLKDSKWRDFRDIRARTYYENPLAYALVYDDLTIFRGFAESESFDINQKITNYVLDLAPPSTKKNFDDELTLIQFAASQGSKSCFLYLLRRGAVFLENKDPTSAACAAIGQNKFILGFVTDVDEKIREEMFRMSGKFNNMYLMILLLQNPINVNSSDSNGSTSLHFATRANNNGIVELLCATKGIDVNAYDENGVTPFHFAVFGGKLEVSKVLAKAPQINVNIQDRHGSTPLHYATWNNDVTLVRYLMTLPGIDINAAAKLDRTPLHEAAKCGFLEVVRALCSSPNIQLNVKDRSGRTPLILAMRRKQIDVVQYMNTLEGVERPETNLEDGKITETEKQTDYMNNGF